MLLEGRHVSVRWSLMNFKSALGSVGFNHLEDWSYHLKNNQRNPNKTIQTNPN